MDTGVAEWILGLFVSIRMIMLAGEGGHGINTGMNSFLSALEEKDTGKGHH